VRAIDAVPDVRIRLQRARRLAIVTKQGRSNTVQVSEGVRAAALSAGLPDDLEILVARDTAATVREALSDVNASIVLGIILCALTIYLFLRSWRGTGIVATSIPICLIGTFAFMAWGGHTLNQMTLLGLALSVGILVDDSIVCLEAITYACTGEPAVQAAIEGRTTSPGRHVDHADRHGWFLPIAFMAAWSAISFAISASWWRSPRLCRWRRPTRSLPTLARSSTVIVRRRS